MLEACGVSFHDMGLIWIKSTINPPLFTGLNIAFISYYLIIYLECVWYVFCMFGLGYFVLVFLWYVFLESRDRPSCIFT